ncbi:MAG: adenylate/guanylate cyclase domain-containing protein, partial [Betaproteobacteria bacterium]
MNVAVNDDVQFLAKFVPVQLAARLTQDGDPDPGNVLEIPSVVLLADISNFTTLAERLIARLGPEGADRLSQMLSACFTIIVDAVQSAGGEVLSIGGDAVLAAWYCDDEPAEDDETRMATIQAVVACCKTMHQGLEALAPIEGTLLSLHIGLAQGLLLVAGVGGVEHRFEIVCGGNVVADVSKAVNHAASGATVANLAFWRAARNVLTGTPLGGGYVSLDRNQKISSSALQMRAFTLPSELQLRYFISDVIASVEFPHLSHWMSQLRLVTALFCRMIDLKAQTRDEFGRLHIAVSAIQQAIGPHGGTLERVHLDEKGVIAVVFFGLPNSEASAHASSAIAAALAIDDYLRGMGQRSAIGVATGKSFSGLVGSPRRTHYTCHGDVPNLAARLMTHTEEGIVCDFDTQRTAQDQYEFQALEPVTLRGLASTVPAFSVLGPRSRQQGAIASVASPLIGRAAEMRTIVDALTEARRGSSRLIVIEGEAGIGKSRLAREGLERASEQGLGVLVSQADRGLSAQPYRIWQKIFEQIVRAPEHA